MKTNTRKNSDFKKNKPKRDDRRGVAYGKEGKNANKRRELLSELTLDLKNLLEYFKSTKRNSIQLQVGHLNYVLENYEKEKLIHCFQVLGRAIASHQEERKDKKHYRLFLALRILSYLGLKKVHFEVDTSIYSIFNIKISDFPDNLIDYQTVFLGSSIFSA